MISPLDYRCEVYQEIFSDLLKKHFYLACKRYTIKCLYRSCTNRKITECGGECFNVDRIIMRMVLYFSNILVIF